MAKNEIANVIVRVGADLSDLSKKLGAADSKLHHFGSAMTSAGKTLTLGLTGPIMGFGAMALKSSVDFDKAMFGVNSVLKLNKAQFADLKQKVLDFSTTTSQSSVEVAHSLRLITAHNFDAADSMKILRVSVDEAGNMMSDTETTTKALVGALNAYGDSADHVTHYSNLMETAVNKSGMDFDMLSHGIGMATGVAASAGVGFAPLLASLMSLRRQGYDVSQGIVYTRALMVSMLKPSKDLKNLFHSWGYESGQAALKGLGFAGVLKKLSDATGGDASKMAALFPNVRALQAAMALSSNGAKEYTSSLKDLASADEGVGEHERMRAIRHQSVAYQMAKMKSEMEVFSIEMGNLLLPTLTQVVHGLTKLFTALNHLSPAQKKMIGLVMLFAAAIGPVLVVIGSMASGIAAIGSVVGLVTPVLGGLVAAIGAIGAPILIVAGAAVALYLAWKNNWFGIRDITASVVKFVKDKVGGFVHSVVNFFENLYHRLVGGSIIPEMFAAMRRMFLHFFTWGLKKLGGFVGGVFTKFDHLTGGALSKTGKLASGVLRKYAVFYATGIKKTQAFVSSGISEYERLRSNGYSVFEALKKTGIDKFSELKSSGLSILGDFVREAYSKGASLAQRFGAGIHDKLNDALNAARGLVGQIRDLLPHSDAKTGPLRDLTNAGRMLPIMLARGIREGEPALVQQAYGMATKLSEVIHGYKAGVGGTISANMGMPGGELRRPLPAGNMSTAWLFPGGGVESYAPPAPKPKKIEDTSLAWLFPGGGVEKAPAPAPVRAERKTEVNITVHNPAPEPASTSITDQLKNLSYLGVLDPIGATTCQ